jgi:hypothetical protein
MSSEEKTSMGEHRHVFAGGYDIPDEEGGQGGWWMSLVSSQDVFTGVVILHGYVEDLLGAVDEVNRIHPGIDGQIGAFPLPAAVLERVPVADLGRLLSKADLAAIGENSKSLRELGVTWQ